MKKLGPCSGRCGEREENRKSVRRGGRASARRISGMQLAVDRAQTRGLCSGCMAGEPLPLPPSSRGTLPVKWGKESALKVDSGVVRRRIIFGE